MPALTLPRVLFVDDEPAICDAVAYALESEGFEVEVRADGEAGLEAARSGPYEVVVLDVMLPRLSGVEVCRRLRAESDVPILMLSARDAEVDRVLGLEIGADDYITKPFSMAELIVRVRAILRRRQLDRRGNGPTIHVVGGLQIDLVGHQVLVDGEPIALTRSEFKLLAFLASQPERVFSRRELMQHLWDSDYVGDERAADIHLSNLRRKIESDPAKPRRLITVRGAGYKLASV
jgi:two-component system, OmpR family, response regulator RegX3